MSPASSAQRSQQVNTLILNANDLLGVLNDRREAIVDLLANTSAVAQQLTGLVADNEKELAPTLEKLNSVTAMLEKNRDNIAKALPGLAKFQLTQGETRVQRLLLQRLRPEPAAGAAPAAVPGLRVRLPARRRCRAAAGQRRTAGRIPVARTTEFREARDEAQADVRSQAAAVCARPCCLRGRCGIRWCGTRTSRPTTITAYFTSATAHLPR